MLGMLGEYNFFHINIGKYFALYMGRGEGRDDISEALTWVSHLRFDESPENLPLSPSLSKRAAKKLAQLDTFS